MIVVVVHAENICDPALAVGPPRAGVQPLRSRSPSERRKLIHDVVRAARPVQPEIDIVLRPPSAAASSPTASSAERTEPWAVACAEIVDQPKDHRVRTTRRGRYVVKILTGSCRPDVRQRDVVQKRRRSRTDQRRIHRIRYPVELILLPGLWIEDLNGAAAVEYLRDVQRSAYVDAEPGLVVIGFRQFDSRQRIRPRIQRRCIV